MPNSKFTTKDLKSKILPVKNIFKNSKRIHTIAFHEFKFVYIFAILSIVISSVLPFISSRINASVIDELINSATNGIFTELLIILLFVYLGLLLLQRIVNVADSFFERNVFYELLGVFTIKMQRVFANLDLFHHEDAKFNDTIQKAQDGYSYRPSNFIMRSFAILRNIVGVVSAAYILINFSLIISIIIVLSLIPSLINRLYFGNRTFGIFDADTEVRRQFFRTKWYVESSNYITEIKSFSLKEWMINRVNEIFFTFHNRQKKINQKLYLYDGLLNILTIVGYGFAYYFLVKGVVTGSLSIGLFTFYVTTMTSLSRSVDNFFRNFATIYEQSLYMDSIFKLMDTKPVIINGSNKINTKDIPTIEFKNVWFKYPNSKKYIFNNLNFKINPGENIAIVGENGAGKTTFVKLLCRFYDVTKGKILINGINIKELDVDDIYKRLALLSQDFGRYHFDVKTNIGIGNIDDIKNQDKIIKAAKLSGAHDFIKDYDKQYKQILSKQFPDGIQPSTGQWQKIALARALFRDPQILILDEPTSAIDPKAEAEIFDNLFDYAKEKSIIIISHRFSTVRNAERIIVIDDGKIIEEGTHEDLIELDGKYKHAFDLQKRGYE